MTHLGYCRYIMTALCMIFLLSACNTMQSKQEKDPAMCKEIKRRLIFSGGTPDASAAWQQNAEVDKLDQDFRQEDCS